MYRQNVVYTLIYEQKEFITTVVYWPHRSRLGDNHYPQEEDQQLSGLLNLMEKLMIKKGALWNKSDNIAFTSGLDLSATP